MSELSRLLKEAENKVAKAEFEVVSLKKINEELLEQAEMKGAVQQQHSDEFNTQFQISFKKKGENVMSNVFAKEEEVDETPVRENSIEFIL